ncbi:MAG TPA: tetratricopeptide repeat protein [Gemmatimonadales bacterium]|nr:tetratricopeptide repeat protein [Gemmatimonadales bacterium]
MRALTAALAREPSSLVYVELAEALRRRGQLAEALQVVQHGLARHPDHADGYDAMGRVAADQGDLVLAREAWERALAIEPEHAGALKGIGFVFWRQGDLKRAVDALEHALAVNPDDQAVRKALHTVKGMEWTEGTEQAEAAPSVPTVPTVPTVFAGLEGSTADILLLDSRGLVLAGGLKASDGSDAAELAAAALAGVSGEASRTASYLKLGAWTTILAEADNANVVLLPAADGALLMVRRDRSTPVGLALRIAERARETAQRWLEGLGA